jgi:hypothetical protein
VSKDAERLAWLVLQAVDKSQTKGSTARLAVPRDPEVLANLVVDITEEELLSVEEYLEDRGYLEQADISLTRGTYTITPAGLRWLQEKHGALESTETAEKAPQVTQPHSATGVDQGPAQHPQPRSWWQRMFGGS